MRYIDRLKTLPPDNADNALILGTALHTGIEKDIQTAIQEYYFSYPVITDAHVTEAMKLEQQIERTRTLLKNQVRNQEVHFEYQITQSRFIGFLDMLVRHRGTITEFDLYDFKYSNNISHYKESRQLHLYKYYFEKQLPGCTIQNMYFVMVPKTNSKQRNGESLQAYRNRLLTELEEPYLYKVEYDPNKVIEHLEIVQDVQEETEYEANNSWLCRYCDYQELCQKGKNYMILPTTERRNITQTQKRKIWIYGAAFSGKTTMLDSAPNPLNLNTDGNVQFVTMPYIPIRDEVTMNGRVANRKYAWEVFEEAITELEKKDNDFKTVIVDLLEDTYESCRVYTYHEMNIQHETDAGYGKGWDMVKTRYLTTIRRFFNLDYENLIVVSHEDVSKDITKRSGQNVTRIAPNIRDAVANKIAGMVDIVARIVVDDDGTRTLNFKSNEVIFGGGRLKGIKQTQIPLSWEALMNVYAEANGSDPEQIVTMSDPEPPKEEEKPKSQSRRKAEPVQTEHVEQAELTEDTFFYIPADDNYVKKHTGDTAPDGGQVITQDEFNEGVKRLAQQTSSEPGKRTRRSRKEA